MSVVTLTGHLGSMGTIATRVADTLGYVLADRELLAEAAQALGWSPEEVQDFDERTHGRGSRLARLLHDFVERAPMTDLDPEGSGPLIASTYGDTAGEVMRPRDERYIGVLSALIRNLAARGNVVIVGRGAQALLAQSDDAVHVRVVCDLEERIARVAERDGMTFQAARRRVEDSDRQRHAWHRKYFDIDYESPYQYDLVLNSGRLPDDVAAGMITQLARSMAVVLRERDAGSPGGVEWSRSPAIRARLRQDWGWIELVEPATGVVAARAHLFATEAGVESAWQGQLESLHFAAGRSALEPGLYFARFGRGRADHLVEVESTEQGLAVYSSDADVPAVSRESSEG